MLPYQRAKWLDTTWLKLVEPTACCQLSQHNGPHWYDNPGTAVTTFPGRRPKSAVWSMKIVLSALARCRAARSKGLYKAEEFLPIPCNSDLDLNTTTAGNLTTLQRVKETLDKHDKDLDQRLPAHSALTSLAGGMLISWTGKCVQFRHVQAHFMNKGGLIIHGLIGFLLHLPEWRGKQGKHLLQSRMQVVAESNQTAMLLDTH